MIYLNNQGKISLLKSFEQILFPYTIYRILMIISKSRLFLVLLFSSQTLVFKKTKNRIFGKPLKLTNLFIFILTLLVMTLF